EPWRGATRSQPKEKAKPCVFVVSALSHPNSTNQSPRDKKRAGRMRPALSSRWRPRLLGLPFKQRAPAESVSRIIVFAKRKPHRRQRGSPIEPISRIEPASLNPALVPHCLSDLLPADLRLLTLP